MPLWAAYMGASGTCNFGSAAMFTLGLPSPWAALPVAENGEEARAGPLLLLHGFPLASLDWAALWFEALSTLSSILPSPFPRCHHLKPLLATSCLPFLYPELASPPIHLMTVSIYLGFGFLYGLNQYTNQQHSLVAEATLNGLSCHLQPKESYYRRGI